MIQEPEHDPRTLLRVSICETLEHTFDKGRKKKVTKLFHQSLS